MSDAPPPYSPTTPPQMPPYSPDTGLSPPVSYGFTQQGSSDPHPQECVNVPAPTCSQPVPAQVVVVGARSCPICKMGFIREEFTMCGICMGIFFFPLGLICCFMMRVRRCSRCHAIVI